MFRASPWISYDPHQLHLPSQPQPLESQPTVPDTDHDPDPDDLQNPQPITDMDAPEISTLREEDTPPPDSANDQLNFSKFRVNLRVPARGDSSASAAAPPAGALSTHNKATSPPDSDDDEEEDQLIDDDEPAIVTETRRAGASSPASTTLGLVDGSPASTPTPKKRGIALRGRQRRGGATGRRGRPGREPPDAAAMMSTFELAKADQAQGPPPSTRVSSPPIVPVAAPPPVPVPSPSVGDSAPPKPPRKKPGPRRGSTLGPRGARKNATNSQLASGRGTPVLDDTLIPPDATTFLIPVAPSIPPTPGSDQHPLPQPHLPPITAPDFTLDPSIPVPSYLLSSRSFPVQAPPKIPGGYATTHPLDPRGAPPRKWKLVQREIRGIGGSRWFARTWVGEKDESNGAMAIFSHAPTSPLPGPPPNPQMESHPSKASEIVHPSLSRQYTSPEPEQEQESPPRSPAAKNAYGTPEPGEGSRIQT